MPSLLPEATIDLEGGMTGDSARVALASGPGQRRRPLFIRQPFRDDRGQIVGLLRLALERGSRLGEAATARSAR